MDLTLSPEIETVRVRARAFVDDRLLPLEAEPSSFGEGEHIREDLLTEVRAEARQRQLWCPQLPLARGGLGLTAVGMAVVYEELGRSRFGPVACNCAPPDDGNMLVLEQARHRGPEGALAAADRRRGGALGDRDDRARPRLRLRPRRDDAHRAPCGEGDRYVVHGHKWFITGAEGAAHFILLARTSDDPRRGLTAFLFHRDQPGWRILRRIPIMGPEEHGGHCELEFDGLEIPVENVLLGEGLGMRVTQTRLAIARLTHCMRWLGMARRALEIALPHVRARRAFGQPLADKESVQGLLGEAALQIEIGRLLTMRAAFELDQGRRAQAQVSMAKIQVADALHRAVDTAIQLLGAKGYSKDTPLEWMYRYARQARLVDGASEVHRMVVARNLLEQGGDFFAWP